MRVPFRNQNIYCNDQKQKDLSQKSRTLGFPHMTHRREHGYSPSSEGYYSVEFYISRVNFRWVGLDFMQVVKIYASKEAFCLPS